MGGDSEGKEVKDLSELGTPTRLLEAMEEALRERSVARVERRLDLEVVEVCEGVRQSCESLLIVMLTMSARQGYGGRTNT